MHLKITGYNNFYEIEGVLSKESVGEFYSEFRNIFEKVNKLTINIQGLEDIDREGVKALAKLHNESISRNKRLSIIGLGQKEVYEHFSSTDAA